MTKILFAGYATIDIINNQFFLGGAAGAMSINATKEKVKSYLITVIGKDKYGQYYRKKLLKNKINLSFSNFEALKNPTCKIINPFSLGSKRIWSDNGANHYLKKINIRSRKLSSFKLIFLANCHPTLIKKIYQKTLTKNLIYIPGPQIVNKKSFFQKKILNKTKIIFCNQEESSYILKTDPFKYKVELVVVTQGKKGGIVYKQTGEKIIFSAPKVKKTIDPTGAGDCFALGFCLSLIKTNSIEKAIKKGLSLSKKIIIKKGAVI